MMFKWFISRTVRQAHHATRHVRKLLAHQRDILSADAIASLEKEIADTRRIIQTGSSEDIRKSVQTLETAANKWLKPYPNAGIRENIEVLLVAIAVAMGIRTFFLQPFKIPTGSMQPTLYGVTDENLVNQPQVKIPGAVAGFVEYWFRGVSYKHVVAKGPGQLTAASKPSKFILFNLKQTFTVGDHNYTVWFPPDGLLSRAGLTDNSGRPYPRTFSAGDDLIKLRIISGDHLFVDRVSYNFRRPRRGDIIVFETHGIYRLDPSQQDTYYIKRLVGMGGEKLSIKPDFDLVGFPEIPLQRIPVGRLTANDKELTGSTERFEHLYSFPHADRKTKTLRYLENHYHGHAALHELEVGRSVNVATNHYYVLGDNTMRSSDSRYWGDFPRERVLGQSCFVYWPIGGTRFNGEDRPSRFGWSHR